MEKKKAWCNLGVIVLLVLFCLVLLPTILLLLMPFLLGCFLALIINPPVRFLERKVKLKRKAGVILLLLVILISVILFTGILIEVLQEEIKEMACRLPEMWKKAEHDLVVITAKWNSIKKYFPGEVGERLEEAGRLLGEEMGTMVGKITIPTAGAVGNMAQKVPEFIIAASMCLLSCYFFLTEKERLHTKVLNFLSPSKREKCKMLKQTTIDVMAVYVKAQLKIEIGIYFFLTLGLFLLGIKAAYLWALPIAFLDLLPLFGTGTMLLPWAVVLLFQGKYLISLGMVVLWGVSLLLRQMIQPKVLGKSLGISPLWALFLLYLGYRLAGITGMIFSVPMGIMVSVMNKAGFFDNTGQSLKIIWQSFENTEAFDNGEKGSY